MRPSWPIIFCGSLYLVKVFKTLFKLLTLVVLTLIKNYIILLCCRFLILQYMPNIELYFFLITRFFLNICLVRVLFYFMMQFFIYVLAKKCTNLSKKFICVLSFAMSALIYSVVPFIILGTLNIVYGLKPFLSFETLKIWSLFLLLGLMVSIPFYSILWCFLRTFKKRFPNRSHWLTHSVPNFLTSFSITALIFSIISFGFLCALESGLSDHCCEDNIC